MKINRKWIITAAAVLILVLILRSQSKSLTGGSLTKGDQVKIQDDFSDQPITGRPQVEIVTGKGKFVIELRPDIAPKTVSNFLAKWANSYCESKTFHRVEDWVVQGCDPDGDGTGGKLNLTTEISSESFTAGSVGVARRAAPRDLSNDSQFFIVKKDSQFLDGEYTYFGKVSSGMDVVNKLTVGDTILGTTVLSK